MSTFSHSRIQTFETCPKKYEYTYVLKVPGGPSGIEAFMGSRVHDALEWLYREVRACRVPDEDELVTRYREVWDEEWDDAVRVTRAERSAADYLAIGEKALRDYHRRYAPFDQGVTVGLELRVSLGLDPEHDIIGFIDRLTKVSDGVWEIHDYKTGSHLPTQAEADADRQLALYELAVREMYPDALDVTLVWHYLAFDHEVRSKRTPEQLAALRAEVLEAVRGIESQPAYQTRVSNICSWCEYQTICPAWRHKSDIEALDEVERPAEDGVALVDEYLEVSDEAARLKARQDALRDAIAELALGRGIERVFGSEGSVKVYRYPSLSLPGVKDPRRAEFEETLRGLGLWERFAAIDSYPISRAIQAGEISSDDVDVLEPFITRSEGVKLYPKRS